jgi:predicted secreted protein
MAFYQGTTMRILIGTKQIFHETDASLSSSLDFKEVASKDTLGKEKTPGSQSWSLSCNSLIGNSSLSVQEDITTLYGYHKAKTLVTIQFTTDISGDVVFSGTAYVGTFNVQATNDEVVTGDFSFEGSGELSIEVVEPVS